MIAQRADHLSGIRICLFLFPGDLVVNLGEFFVPPFGSKADCQKKDERRAGCNYDK